MEDRIFKIAISIVVVIILLLTAAHLYKGSQEEDSNKELIKHVTLYTKEGCRFCMMAESLLDKYGIRYNLFDISNNEDLQKKLFEQTNQNTVPYIFIKGDFIGGYSQLMEMANNGELSDMASELIKLEKGK